MKAIAIGGLHMIVHCEPQACEARLKTNPAIAPIPIPIKALGILRLILSKTISFSNRCAVVITNLFLAVFPMAYLLHYR